MTPLRLLERGRLEPLTRVTPRLLAVFFVPGIVVLAGLAYASLGALLSTSLIVVGYCAWTLFEYWIHRIVLHWEPRGRLLALLHWMGHGHHHADPRDPLRQFFPLMFSIPICGSFVLLFVVTLQPPMAWGVATGFVGGYFTMDLTHHWLHRGKPRHRVGRWLHERHMRHHFQDDNCGFGISTPIWDLVFRTYSSRSGQTK